MYELKSAKETVAELVSDEKSGLTSEEASKRLAQYGPNELLEKKKGKGAEGGWEQRDL